MRISDSSAVIEFTELNGMMLKFFESILHRSSPLQYFYEELAELQELRGVDRYEKVDKAVSFANSVIGEINFLFCFAADEKRRTLEEIE